MAAPLTVFVQKSNFTKRTRFVGKENQVVKDRYERSEIKISI